jgi:hypothetical protein
MARQMLRWDVVRWATTAEGVYAGTTVDRCATLDEAEEICAYHTDMMNPDCGQMLVVNLIGR